MVLAPWRHGECLERNSLSGEQLPGARVTVHINPAHNGEALPGRHAKDVTTWPAGNAVGSPLPRRLGMAP